MEIEETSQERRFLGVDGSLIDLIPVVGAVYLAARRGNRFAEDPSNFTSEDTIVPRNQEVYNFFLGAYQTLATGSILYFLS